MNLEEIKKRVEYLEDRVIHNFEKHFSYLVLEDFYDGGYDDVIDDEFFYEEYYSKYQDEVTNLLIDIEDDMASEFMSLKIRLIKLKRIIDTRLAKIEIENEVPLRLKKRSVQFILNDKFDKEKFIDLLHSLLIENRLINVDIESFKSHFESNWNTKIQWLGTELQITNLITSFIEKEYLDVETQNFKNKLIASHFINKNGNLFKEKQLGSVYSEKKDMIATDDVTFKIISRMSTYF